MNKIYLLSPLAQKKETEELCFKKCGQILIGGIVFMDAPWLPCRTEKCPYLDKEFKAGKGEIRGTEEIIIVRKIKDKNGIETNPNKNS